MCPICMRFLESAIHALWECDMTKDVWFGSLKILQKGVLGLVDLIHLMEYLLDWVELQDMEVVLVQAWLIWNQRNQVVHGGQFHDLGWLINRAKELLEKFQIAQEQMGAEQVILPAWDTRQPPSQSVFKLNFDAVFSSCFHNYKLDFINVCLQGIQQ